MMKTMDSYDDRYSGDNNSIDIDTKFFHKISDILVEAANSVSNAWEKIAIIINQVEDKSGVLVGVMLCPFIVSDGQRYLGNWMPEHFNQRLVDTLAEWQQRLVDGGYKNWTAMFFGMDIVDFRYHGLWYPDYSPGGGRWRIHENEASNWETFEAGFGGSI